jgi:hypothetical protein
MIVSCEFNPPVHSQQFRYVNRSILGITLLFLGVILYQFILMKYHIF